MTIVFCLSMHFFANLWVFVGITQLRDIKTGWVHRNIEEGIQLPDFFSLYISSVYWVFTSFTTVGYGDIRGHTTMEMLVQILVTMIGICLFSWMSAIIKEIIETFQVRDLNDENADLIDNWLFKVDKSRTELLPKAIINIVRDFFQKKFKYDPSVVVNNSEIFDKLKPRL